jgi:glycosyltransferase involved in cell wall biosynthesis
MAQKSIQCSILSIVVPLYNEQENLAELLRRLTQVLEQIALPYEIVCVNDGSSDATLSTLLALQQTHPEVNLKIISLARNFGKEAAMSAGLDYASGDAVIPIDADLQDPPELIGELVEQWQQGYDVVYAVRRSRQGESWIKKATAKAFYRVIGQLSKVEIPANTGDFRLLDRRVVEVLKSMPERTRFMKGLFSWVGFRQTAVYFDREPRQAGQTSWNYWKLWNFALDGIASFSQLPLKVWTYVGFVTALVAFGFALLLIVRTLLLGIDVPGYASIMVAVLLLGGLQLMGMGVIGEYLGRVYEETKERPLYVIRDLYGFKDEKTPATLLPKGRDLQPQASLEQAM